MTRNIDELSNLTTKRAVEPKKYFEEMDLTEEQVKKRVEYTEKAYDIYDLILIMILTMADTESINFKLARGMLERQLQSLINEYITADDYLIDYASDMAFDFIDTTAKHISKEWYTSSDRALFNAENGANDVFNYIEYKEAIESGKTHKKWITERDNRVRETHKEVSNKVIPIKDFFRVGLSRMRFPKDYEYAGVFPEEIVNCRCSIEYINKDDEDRQTTTLNKESSNENEWVKEITASFFEGKTPGKGSVNYEEAFVNKNNEKENAEWLLKTFGGNIICLSESNEDNVLSPDYLWNGKYWDLKTIKSSKVSTVKKRIKKGLRQIEKGIGGVLVDATYSNMEVEDIKDVMNKITESHFPNEAVVIVRKKDKYKVYGK